MPFFVSVSVAMAAAGWLMLHRIIRRKLGILEARLPAVYRDAVAASKAERDLPKPATSPAALVPLSTDLIRASYSEAEFEALSPRERQAALYALAIEELPHWVMAYVNLFVLGADRALVRKLRWLKQATH